MTQKSFRKMAVVMAAGLSFFAVAIGAQTGTATQSTNANQNTTPNANANQPPKTPRANVTVPAAFEPGIAALTAAKSALEGAGDKWGGHRVKAIHLIDQALAACGQKSAAPGEMKSGNTDVASALQTGITQLTNAQNVFSQATDDWAGRRDKAVNFMNQALQELQAAQASQKSKPQKPSN
jgi:hypothetical protein